MSMCTISGTICGILSAFKWSKTLHKRRARVCACASDSSSLRSYSTQNSSESLNKLRGMRHKSEVDRFLKAVESIQILTEDVHPHLDEIVSGKTIVLDFMLMAKSSTSRFSA